MTKRAIRVLLVEDSRADAIFIREILKEPKAVPFEVFHVSRLGEGLDHLRAEPFEAILLDLNLPDSEGIDTFLQTQSHAHEVPIVMLTSLCDENVAIQAVREGAQDYLVKGQVDGRLLSKAILYAIERHRLQTLLRNLSIVDELTGLYNRRGFMTLAGQSLNVALRTKKESLLLYLDLDGLKRINDTFGHQEGDLALKRTAEILSSTFRKTDIIARLGGDEFTVCVLDAAQENIKRVVCRLKDHLDRYNAKTDRPYRLSLSVGAARFDPSQPISMEELISRADKALYEHKRGHG